jgi:hypothetical protein
MTEREMKIIGEISKSFEQSATVCEGFAKDAALQALVGPEASRKSQTEQAHSWHTKACVWREAMKLMSKTVAART